MNKVTLSYCAEVSCKVKAWINKKADILQRGSAGEVPAISAFYQEEVPCTSPWFGPTRIWRQHDAIMIMALIEEGNIPKMSLRRGD